MSKEWDPENVFDVLGCEIAREILAIASHHPVSAEALADHCGVSPPTVYRRLHALQEYDMVDDEQAIDEDGYHYKQFTTTLTEARFHVEDGTFDVDIRLRKDYTDKVADFWEDLERGTETSRPFAEDSPSSRPDGTVSDTSGS